MSAPAGNQFWKLRSKHGRDTLFESSDKLWEAACEYFEWCDDNPFTEIDYRGKDMIMVELPKMRPYTMHGLCIYLGCNTAYFKNFKLQNKGKSEDFNAIITRIEEIIYNQKFSGAASGFFNPNIIARDLGLSDKSESRFTDKNGEDLPLPQIIIQHPQ